MYYDPFNFFFLLPWIFSTIRADILFISLFFLSDLVRTWVSCMLRKFISMGARWQMEQQNTFWGPFFCFPFRLYYFLLPSFEDLIQLATVDKEHSHSSITGGIDLSSKFFFLAAAHRLDLAKMCLVLLQLQLANMRIEQHFPRLKSYFFP